jgi:hypothetical protein
MRILIQNTGIFETKCVIRFPLGVLRAALQFSCKELICPTNPPTPPWPPRPRSGENLLLLDIQFKLWNLDRGSLVNFRHLCVGII